MEDVWGPPAMEYRICSKSNLTYYKIQMRQFQRPEPPWEDVLYPGSIGEPAVYIFYDIKSAEEYIKEIKEAREGSGWVVVETDL